MNAGTLDRRFIFKSNNCFILLRLRFHLLWQPSSNLAIRTNGMKRNLRLLMEAKRNSRMKDCQTSIIKFDQNLCSVEFDWRFLIWKFWLKRTPRNVIPKIKSHSISLLHVNCFLNVYAAPHPRTPQKSWFRTSPVESGRLNWIPASELMKLHRMKWLMKHFR